MSKKHDERMEEYYVYLDALRESGVTNMYGAAPYLVEEFGFTKKKAREILVRWMETYSVRHPR